MSDVFANEPMLEMYIVEMNQMINRLEQLVMNSENENTLDEDIDEIFRHMHTIKGNSMMMMFEAISNLAHAVEDLYDYLRKEKPKEVNYSKVTDLVLEAIDFFKAEVESIESGDGSNGDSDELKKEIRDYLESIKFMNDGGAVAPQNSKEEASKASTENQKYYIAPQKEANSSNKPKTTDDHHYYHIKILFEEDCQMESVRAFSVVHKLKDVCDDIFHFPKNIVEENHDEEIRNEGFQAYLCSEYAMDSMNQFFESVSSMRSVDIEEIEMSVFYEYKDLFDGVIKEVSLPEPEEKKEVSGETVSDDGKKSKEKSKKTSNEKYINVGISRIDQLLDLVGELVVSESMVTRNTDLQGLKLESFEKSVRQHRFIINELQDVVMSIRMVPLSLTFQKMNRIVRDMKKKIGKNVELTIIGEHTEVDKNVIEHIGDPLMHIIRNSIDHGIESPAERIDSGKPEKGTVTLEAKHAGGDVWIIVKDDGKGLNRERILEKALSRDLLRKEPHEYTDQEVYGMIFKPGFSTKEQVTEFSGRGVGLDVVQKNIQKLGGNVVVNSTEGIGTEFAIRIPLTLAIIDGMLLRVGHSSFTVPIISIKESFKAEKNNIVTDPDGHMMVMVRGQCYPIIKLYDRYNIASKYQSVNDGIIIMLESDGKEFCIFADEIIGEQQVVVKSLSKFLTKVNGISGCTLLGDGRISLILDPSEMIHEI
ncbi:MAG: chemotaxis protein CheA [Clostridia bacterium]|nr:chemotaxis protein CheA [Clostridia bacterium]